MASSSVVAHGSVGAWDPASWMTRTPRVSTGELAGFLRQLATLLKAGLPLYRALSLLAEESAGDQNPALHDAVQNLMDRVRRGDHFSAALAAAPHIFPPMMVSIVKAGELSGSVEMVLEKYAGFVEKQYETVKHLQSLLVYPLLLLSVGLLSIGFLLIFVIPRFVGIFQEFGQRLPWITQLLLDASTFIRTQGWMAAIVAVLAGLAGKVWMASAQGRAIWMRGRYAIPLIGPLLLKVDLSRFSLILGTLVGSGVPMLDALSSAKDTVNNPWLVKDLDDMSQQIRRGSSVSDAMRSGTHFPSLMTQLMAVGEETGKPEELLLHIHTFYEREVERDARTLLSLVEPMMVVILGVMVGTMVMAVLLPILTLSTTVR